MGCVMTRLKVNVSFRGGVFVSEANHTITRSLTALSLKMLRNMVVALQSRQAGEEISLTLLLDSAAQREWDRRRATVGV